MVTLEELEARVRRLEDIEAIKKLTATFTYLIDDRDWQSLLELFTEDCKYDAGIAQYEGREGLIKFFRDDLPAGFSFSAHMLHNTVIDVNDDRATGRWYVEIPATRAQENRALWVLTKYENEYVKVGGEWRFKNFVSNIVYITPFDEGWAKTKRYV